MLNISFQLLYIRNLTPEETGLASEAEVEITACYGDNRVDAEKLGPPIKSRSAELQLPQIEAMALSLTELVSDLKCSMVMDRAVDYATLRNMLLFLLGSQNSMYRGQ
jgi:hypothetical protein